MSVPQSLKVIEMHQAYHERLRKEFATIANIAQMLNTNTVTCLKYHENFISRNYCI